MKETKFVINSQLFLSGWENKIVVIKLSWMNSIISLSIGPKLAANVPDSFKQFYDYLGLKIKAKFTSGKVTKELISEVLSTKYV